MQKRKAVKIKSIELNDYEQSIEDALRALDLEQPNGQAQGRLKLSATKTLKKLKVARTNIRLKAGDMLAIRKLAQTAGIPYQTFIAHVLHLYVSGRLLNVDEVRKIVASGVLSKASKTG